ncbi:helix-turn-helix domain-containing protein [Streptomyces orinoci]|uniref:Helix-turn-helix transcriptional regulator n=1 Tax=Streptomyces orinoci TaxID=67339 RepID=A0ABV3JVE6_STRON|nr:helix-turn-helix transcriptional regulator [Streptomyces orinoci]
MANNPLYQDPSESSAEVMSPNQLVSYNLLRARRARGWTQQQLGELLGRYTGRVWSNASVSAAERAWQGGRPRKFDADEIAAFCRIFDVPFSYFLMPPSDADIVAISTAEGEGSGMATDFPVIEYLKCILGVDGPADFTDRAQEIVSAHASLDFFPAKWDWDGSHGLPRRTWPLSELRDTAPEPLVDAGAVKPSQQLTTGLSAKADASHMAEQLAQKVAQLLEARGCFIDRDLQTEVRLLRGRIDALETGCKKNQTS